MTTQQLWHEANQRFLSAALAQVRDAVQRHAARVNGAAEPVAAEPEAAEVSPNLAPPALASLCATFRLSPFERDLLVLCAGVELDARIPALCAAAQGDPQRTYATFSLALAALPGAHWSAITPAAPLRHWRLIEVAPANSLTLSPLRIDERVLHYLAGIAHPDERLAGLVRPIPWAGDLVPSHEVLAGQIRALWAQANTGPMPIAQLCGSDRSGILGVAAAACAAAGVQAYRVTASALPTASAEIESLARLWEREAAIAGAALLIDCFDLDTSDALRTAAVTGLAERVSGVVLLAGRDPWRGLERTAVTFDIRKPGPAEQRSVWHTTLGTTAASLNGHVDLLVSQFNLGAPAIRAVAAEAVGRLAAGAADDPAAVLWDICRTQARSRLDDLAQRIEADANWDDLVLPGPQRQILRDVAAHVRQRARVYEQWGFGGQGSRGLGISALFAGASGTGKTMAAEVLARTLRLDLYRIDLSSVVSKYIGETEKNLRRIFDAAEEAGAILLFDEADALFGKRSEVKDSHDRYANIEVSYLLQRMEAYRGLAILTTNLKQSIDTAFMRRIRFIVQFPFPDTVQRAEIWRRAFPHATPTEGLEPEKLARLNVAGGNIRSIALNAAFLAADAGEPVRMIHVLRAARAEYAKLEKSLTEAEIAGWVRQP